MRIYRNDTSMVVVGLALGAKAVTITATMLHLHTDTLLRTNTRVRILVIILLVYTADTADRHAIVSECHYYYFNACIIFSFP